MVIEKVRFAYFTPAQLTRKIVYRVVAGVAGGLPSEQYNLTSVKERQKEHQIPANQLLVAAVPTFGGRIPQLDPPLLRNLHGQGGPAVVVVTYGNRGYDDTLLETQQILQQQGFKVIAGGAFVTMHSLAPAFVGAGRPDLNDLEAATEFGKKVRQKLDSMPQEIVEIKLPGNNPFKELAPKANLSPITNEKCVLCMQCFRWCPMDAITYNNPNETDASKCILCQSCVIRCPVEAREVTDEGFLQKVEKLKQDFSSQHMEPEFFL